MVAPRIKVSLIDSSSNQVLVHEVRHSLFLCCNHVVERVIDVFQPELIFRLNSFVRIASFDSFRKVERIGVRTV
jgi:hypothetical protein